MTMEQKNILVEQYIRNVAFNLNQQIPNIVDEEKISKAIDMFKDSNEEFDEIKKKIDELVTELINNYIKSKNQNDVIVSNEQLMMQNLEKVFDSDTTIEMLKRNWNEKHSINLVGNLIGEIYNHMIIHKDGYGFEYYITQMEMLYAKLGTKEISLEDFDREKATLITNIIAQKLNIDTSRDFNEVDIDRIKNYFLQEYVTNGFVSHSFPEAYHESIMANGLVPSLGGRDDVHNMSQIIQKMFMEKGVVAPFGPYSYYNGSGIYYEHDFTKVFQHAINSPSWFNWFTSSDHLKGNFQDIKNSPYVLRDLEACTQNVSDLCMNSGLSPEQVKTVMGFYADNYVKFSSPILNVGLIPKSVVGKNDAGFVPTDLGLHETITYVMRDEAKQYVDHVGNVHNKMVFPKDIMVSRIPDASKFMNVSSYSRETSDNLLSPNANLHFLEEARAKSSSSMSEDVEKTRLLLQSRISNQGRYNENHTIMSQNQQNLTNQKHKVKTLKKTINNNGYANMIILPLIIVFAFVIAFLITGLLLK